jgi:hypothetical protein
MTYKKISELSKRSMPGAFDVKFYDANPFLAYEIKVGGVRKKPSAGNTKVTLTGYSEDGRWGKKPFKLYQIKEVEQVGVKGLLKMIAERDNAMHEIKIAAEKVASFLKAIGI